MKKVIDAIPTLVTDGIFNHITEPMWDDYFSGHDLDLHFAAKYSQKWISPLVELLADSDGEVKGENLSKLANSIYDLRKNEWSHLFLDLQAEYDPIENTDYTESESITRDRDTTNGNTRTLNTSEGTTASGTSSSNGSTTVTGSGTDSVYGFDSVSAVPDASSSTSTGTTATSSATTGNNSTVTNTGTITDSGSGTDDETVTRNLRKHGNIGVQTNAQVLEMDTSFWLWSFIDVIFNEVAEFITLSVY